MGWLNQAESTAKVAIHFHQRAFFFKILRIFLVDAREGHEAWLEPKTTADSVLSAEQSWRSSEAFWGRFRCLYCAVELSERIAFYGVKGQLANAEMIFFYLLNFWSQTCASGRRRASGPLITYRASGFTLPRSLKLNRTGCVIFWQKDTQVGGNK